MLRHAKDTEDVVRTHRNDEEKTHKKQIKSHWQQGQQSATTIKTQTNETKTTSNSVVHRLLLLYLLSINVKTTIIASGREHLTSSPPPPSCLLIYNNVKHARTFYMCVHKKKRKALRKLRETHDPHNNSQPRLLLPAPSTTTIPRVLECGIIPINHHYHYR